jgi:hypothetical protein
VVRPRSYRVIYYFDTPALGIRHQFFYRVTSQQSDKPAKHKKKKNREVTKIQRTKTKEKKKEEKRRNQERQKIS